MLIIDNFLRLFFWICWFDNLKNRIELHVLFYGTLLEIHDIHSHFLDYLFIFLLISFEALESSWIKDGITSQSL